MIESCLEMLQSYQSLNTENMKFASFAKFLNGICISTFFILSSMRLELLKHPRIINGNVKNSSQMIEKEG